MDELRYQIDLLKAMNQKLVLQEHIYKTVCDMSSAAMLFYSFERDEAYTLGNWDNMFDFKVRDMKDISRFYELIDEAYVLKLRESLFLEKKGEKETSIECKMRDSMSWLRFHVWVIYENDCPSEKVIVIHNVTKYHSQNEELEYMAYYDALTGLYNRNYFVRKLGEFVRRAEEEQSIVSTMIIDIDDFRKINDGRGIVVGDELVQQFGFLLKELSEGDENLIACHLSSDVYCFAIYDPVGNRSVETIAQKIRDSVRDPFRMSNGEEIKITVSIGVAEYPEAARNALELINFAEIVMYKGKALGKNTVQYFDTPILNEFLNSIDMENRLKETVIRNGFEMYYQPQFYSGNKKLRGAEALIRWFDEEKGMIGPDKFISIAEKNGSIIEIGKWVIEQSVMQYAKWREKYGMRFIMSINISALQYKRDDFVDFILRVLRRYNVSPSEIELEITESILIEDFQSVMDRLCRLRDTGVRISLDDFGTGYSSLSYLKKLPIDTLKIDKSFIDTVLNDSSTRIITESIINMADALGMETIAEGVELEQQYRYLHSVGCDVIQGYLFGKPQSAEDFEKLLDRL